MAGYVFAIGDTKDSKEAVKACVKDGVYSTFIKSLTPGPFEGTLADYLSMKPGDNVYFFCKRRYYGVGKLISVGPDCKYCNYPDSSRYVDFEYDAIHRDLLVDYGDESAFNRWICTFEGDPAFFEEGIDTDEILVYKPDTFKMLRAFWKLSFIKLGDEENKSLKEIFLLRHQKELAAGGGILPVTNAVHRAITKHSLSQYLIEPAPLLRSVSTGNRLKHEMALEAAVVYDLSKDRLQKLLGHWDYISHQVIASPFKPVDYMDKIDVFASRYLPQTEIPCKYLTIELKKDLAGKDTIDQVLKYVDWVCNEYAYGDYGAVEAAVIAYGFETDVAGHYSAVVKRHYTMGSHPVRNEQWNGLKLIRYRYEGGQIKYTDETPTA